MAGLVRGAVPRGAGDAIARVPRIVAAIKIVILWSRGAGDVSRFVGRGGAGDPVRPNGCAAVGEGSHSRRRKPGSGGRAGDRVVERARTSSQITFRMSPGRDMTPRQPEGGTTQCAARVDSGTSNTCVSTMLPRKALYITAARAPLRVPIQFLVHEPRNTCSS